MLGAGCGEAVARCPTERYGQHLCEGSLATVMGGTLRLSDSISHLCAGKETIKNNRAREVELRWSVVTRYVLAFVVESHVLG